jgi:putative ABC transport system permease protein
MLAKSPGMTAVVVLTFALCIGANTAIFSVVNNVLLNPLPQRDSTGLVHIRSFDKERGADGPIDGPTWEELRQLESVFADLVAFEGTGFEWEGDDFVEQLPGSKVSPGFFRFWEVSPLLGRTFTADESKPGAPPVILLSHQFWRSHCGGRPDIVGQTIQLRDFKFTVIGFTVIGVMPRHVRFPGHESFWLPWEGPHTEPQAIYYGRRDFQVLAQLAPGVTKQQLQSILTAMGARQAVDHPEECRNYTIQARPLREVFSSDEIRKTLVTLLGAVGFVLLIACANIASLLLARNEARQRELAMRAALGAVRHRLVRQLLTESTLLSMLGGISGLVVAWLGTGLLRTLIPAYMPSMRPVRIDVPMLSFTLVVSLMVGLAVGLVPAWFCSGKRIGESLKEAATSASLSAGRRLAGRLLVVSELAMAVILLAGAGLMINSVVRLLSVDPGFDPANLVKITVDTNVYGDQARAETRDQLVRQMADRFASLPGVKMVGVTHYETTVPEKYLPEGSDQAMQIGVQPVGVGPHDGLRAIGIPLLAGRYFDAGDQAKGRHTIIVNETLAKLCWPGQSTIGKTLRLENRKDWVLEVVGVVGDVRDQAYAWRPDPTYYCPFENYRFTFRQWYSLFVRTRVDPASLVPVLRGEMKAIAPGITRPSFQVVEQLLYDSTAGKRAYMSYLSGFAAVGLFLSAMGIYSLLAWTVVRQTREIGIRMALGARPGKILGMVLRDGLTMIFTGLAFGIVGALALTRVISGFLYEVSPTDPATFAAVALFLIAVSLLACYLPARRATRIDPMVALRYE